MRSQDGLAAQMAVKTAKKDKTTRQGDIGAVDAVAPLGLASQSNGYLDDLLRRNGQLMSLAHWIDAIPLAKTHAKHQKDVACFGAAAVSLRDRDIAQVLAALSSGCGGKNIWDLYRRSRLVTALAIASPRQALPLFISQLEHKSTLTRTLAARGLQLVGPSACVALPALKRRLRDVQSPVFYAAKAAILRIDPNDPMKVKSLWPHGTRKWIHSDQTTRVYSAECWVKARKGGVFTSLDEIHHWLTRIFSTRWFRNRYPGVDGFRVHHGGGSSAARGGAIDGICHLYLPRWSRRKFFVLHELAHGLADDDWDGHGPNYCSEYLRLINRFLGSEARNELKIAFEMFDVRYRLAGQRY